MFKLVVLCSMLAAAAAKPGALLAPVSYATTLYSAPATTTITRQASGVVHPSPLLYTAPLTYTHFIKKRSAPLISSHPYVAATAYTTPLIASTYAAAPLIHAVPLSHPAPLVYSTAHLIKKRSAPFAYSAYIAPTYNAAAPLIPTTYTALPVHHATPLVHSAPIAYSTHFIKKRSAPLAVSAYFAPTSYSHQSRVDVHSTPLVTSYTAPIVYSAPLTHVI